MSGRLFQEVHVVNAMPAANQAAYEDIFNGSPSTDIVNLGKYEKCLWILQKAAGATGSAVITVGSCDTVVPGTATAVAFNYWTCTSGDTWSDMQTATSAGFTTTVGTDQAYAIEINSSELYSTDKYARMTMTESVNDPVDGTVVCIMGGGRSVHEVSDTAIV
ncbi:MAG: hypothetical protein WC055_00300 [Melioribacteraceae bacterium]